MDSRKVNQAIVGLLMGGLLASCAGSSIGDNVQQSLEADPQLEESAPFDSNEAAAVADPSSQPEDESPTDQASAPKPDTAEADSPQRNSADPADGGMIGPVNQTKPRPQRSLQGVPADLQSYIRDLQRLDQLTLTEPDPSLGDRPETGSASPFTQSITRREYARWLFAVYNTLYADEPGDRLRPGNASDDLAFQDVGANDPDFAAVQGLADAGLIPSAFTGNSTDVNFRPDALLTRTDLILWKVPLDTRATLPTTTPEAVKTAWGFQDTDSIDPLALRAIAADFQLGDFANFRRAFGYTTLFRPDKAVTRAEAAAVLWRFGTQTEGVDASSAAAN